MGGESDSVQRKQVTIDQNNMIKQVVRLTKDQNQVLENLVESKGLIREEIMQLALFCYGMAQMAHELHSSTSEILVSNDACTKLVFHREDF